MIKSKFLFFSLQETNSLPKKTKLVCSLLISVKYGQVAERLSLHCGTEPGFHHRAAENNRSSTALFAAFYQKKLAGRNVSSRLLNLVFVTFIFSLITRTKSRFCYQCVLKYPLL